jgi:hypothetical protein
MYHSAAATAWLQRQQQQQQTADEQHCTTDTRTGHVCDMLLYVQLSHGLAAGTVTSAEQQMNSAYSNV